MNKYAPLEKYLEIRKNSHVPMTFSEIEEIIHDDLPHSARKHRAWWSNNPSNSVITYAWLGAGYKTTQVNMESEKLVFQRDERNAPRDRASADGIGPHPLVGSLQGQVTVSVGFDLTGPTGDQWEAEVE